MSHDAFGPALPDAIPAACTATPVAAPSQQKSSESDFLMLYESYDALIRSRLRKMLGYRLYKAEGQDLAQEVYLSLVKSAPTLPTHAHRVGWFTTVARNVAISALRRHCMITNSEEVERL